MRWKLPSAVVAAMALTYSQSALAYLDPGAGSMMLQMLIAGILGAVFTIKLYWYKFKAFVARLLGREVDAELDDSADKAPELDNQ